MKSNDQNPENHDAESLLKAAQAGDDDALAELLEGFRPMLRADACRTLADVRVRIDPSDAVQVTWWSAFRAFPRFEGNVNEFIAWLHKIHDRNLRDLVRDQKAERRALKREVDPNALLPEAAGRGTSPSQRAIHNEEFQRMQGCLNQLPEAQKVAVSLRFYQGLSIAEIVAQMDRPETAVAGLLKRGLSRMRELMKADSRQQ